MEKLLATSNELILGGEGKEAHLLRKQMPELQNLNSLK